MSLTSDDLIWIPPDPEVLVAAAAYTCRCLQYPCNRDPRPAPRELKRRSSTAAAELITRRWLALSGIPYQLAAPAPVTEPDYHILVLGGRQARVVPSFLRTPGPVDQYETLLSSSVSLVRWDRRRPALRRGDLLIFVFLVLCQPTLESSAPCYLAAWPPAVGISRRAQTPFPYIRSGSPDEVQLELAGLEGANRLATGHLVLPPFALASLHPAFQTLLYVHPVVRPGGKLELFAESPERIWAIAPQDWVDLVLPLSGAVLAGWTTVRGYERGALAERDAASAKLRLATPSIRVRELRPMQELARRLCPPP